MEYTSTELEELLARTSYAPIERMNKQELTKEQRYEVNDIENVVSFGNDSINLFDTLIHQLGTLPTQAQYVDAGLQLMIDWLKENKSFIEITDTKVEALKLRMTRTYMSKVIELHLDAIVKEDLSHISVKTFSMLDSVMGVDLVMEDDKKRYYVHVTSNTPFAQKMLLQKEDRGGYKVGTNYIPYSRDFSNDLILKYDVHAESETTMIVNGFPLFRPDFIEERFFLAKRQSTIGENINTEYSKLQHFKDWAKTQLNMTINNL